MAEGFRDGGVEYGKRHTLDNNTLETLSQRNPADRLSADHSAKLTPASRQRILMVDDEIVGTTVRREILKELDTRLFSVIAHWQLSISTSPVLISPFSIIRCQS